MLMCEDFLKVSHKTGQFPIIFADDFYLTNNKLSQVVCDKNKQNPLMS